MQFPFIQHKTKLIFYIYIIMKLHLSLIRLPDGSYQIDTFDKTIMEMLSPDIEIIDEVDIHIKRCDFWKLWGLLRTINDFSQLKK